MYWNSLRVRCLGITVRQESVCFGGGGVESAEEVGPRLQSGPYRISGLVGSEAAEELHLRSGQRYSSEAGGGKGTPSAT